MNIGRYSRNRKSKSNVDWDWDFSAGHRLIRSDHSESVGAELYIWARSGAKNKGYQRNTRS